MKEIIFEDIRDELKKRIPIALTPYDPSRFDQEIIDNFWSDNQLLDGITYKCAHMHLEPVETSYGAKCNAKAGRFLLTFLIKELGTGIIHEIDLQHLMPELFE